MLLRTAVLVQFVHLVTLLCLVLGVPQLAHGQSATGPPPGVAVHPTATFDPSGRVWVTWVEDSHVVVAHSSDQGHSFSPGVRVTRKREPLDANGDARPKVAIGGRGEVFVAWTRAGTRPYTGDIRFARSVDDGHTFSEPIIVNDDGLATGHRFETLGVNANGDIFLVWIDKRDLEAAQANDQDYAGAALYYTWSTDGGLTFGAEPQDQGPHLRMLPDCRRVRCKRLARPGLARRPPWQHPGPSWSSASSTPTDGPE